MKRKTLSWFTPILAVVLLMASMSGSTLSAKAAEKHPATSPASPIKLAILVPLTGPSFLGTPPRGWRCYSQLSSRMPGAAYWE